MPQDIETELRAALAEGIVGREEAEALRSEAASAARTPLDLLRDRGRISDATLASLRRGAVHADLDATASVVTPPGARGGASPEALGSTLQAPPRDGAEGEAAPPDPSVTATVDPARAGQPRDTPVFPVAGWDRYQPVRFLGQGGMGQVFLARDVRLRREVAIKFVRGDDPAHIARLLSEARAQASVDHQRVCKVYEVGEVQGEIYIAMQYIEGKTLGALVEELSVEQKAMMVRDAALGVHEAHRAGIIHRDLKPGNIMVARGEDGRLEPYVMDFGLARSFTEGVTETGTVMGTPHYMAPEQARGEVQRLDRRADVYSLGATLYYMLTRAPAVPGDNMLEVLSNIANVEPRPPRVVDPDIPADLEAITLKCLEKDRSARYESARALAEDLDRFLSGEPVRARPAGLGYRLRKRLWKHRRAASAAAIALLAVLVAVGFGLSARAEAAQRERLARRFTELVEHIEATARYSALSPLHDVRGDRAGIRAKMAELRAEVDKAGPVAAGPGSYALGRGYMALGEEDEAREALEAAWQHGFHEPRAAYALALVLGHSYARELREVERINQKDRREEQKRAIEQKYRDPALAYLAQSQGAEVPSTPYVAALVAFYEGRYDDALRELAAASGGLPWFYELPALRGDVLEARASRRWHDGDREGALADFESGRKAYAEAGAIGESAPAVHEALGELEFAAMLMELYGQGDVKPRFERGLAAVQRALVALPDDRASLVLEAQLYERFAEHEADTGAKVDDLLAKAVAAAERALALAPSDPKARMELGRSYYQRGSYQQDHDQDPRAELQKAIDIFSGTRAEDRDYDHHLYLGLVYQTLADYEDQVGTDALPDRGRTIDAYLAATRVDGRQTPAWINLGATYFRRASNPRGLDPDGDLQRAEGAFDKARAINPKHVVPYFYAGEVHQEMGRRVRDKGGDARSLFSKAIEDYKGGLAINPAMWHLHTGTGLTLLELAREAWDRGQSPDALVAQALAELEQAVVAAPDQGLVRTNVGEAFLHRARWQAARGEDPTESARAALEAFQRAVKLSPEQPLVLANLGSIHAFLAEQDLDRGRDPGEHVAAASAALGKALRNNPRETNAHILLGETRGVSARFEAQRGRPSGDGFAAARDEFEKAIALAPESLDHRLAYVRLCASWASSERKAGRDPGPPLARGLELVEQVLAARPSSPEARVLRASLRTTEAQAAKDPARQREVGARAAEDFAEALAANPNLDHAWSREAAMARRLGAAPP